MQDKLAGELLGRGQQPRQLREEEGGYPQMAEANKAFAHYRW